MAYDSVLVERIRDRLGEAGGGPQLCRDPAAEIGLTGPAPVIAQGQADFIEAAERVQGYSLRTGGALSP
jgi:hypothetical protein